MTKACDKRLNWLISYIHSYVWIQTILSSQTSLAERRIIPNSTEVHWRDQNYSYEFGCQARQAHWWLLEHWWLSRLVWTLDRFHTIYSTRRKSSRRIYVVRGEIDEKTAYVQARSSMARTLEINGKTWQAEGKAKVVWMKRSSILKTQENCVGFISSTPRIRNSRNPSRTRVRSWKHQYLLLFHVKFWRIVGVVEPTKIKQNLRVFLKLMNPQECVWETRYHQITKTISQKMVKIHYSTAIWCTNLFLCHKLWKFRQRKQQWTKNGKNWGKFRRGTWRNSEVRNKWSMKQGRRALQFILHH